MRKNSPTKVFIRTDNTPEVPPVKLTVEIEIPADVWQLATLLANRKHLHPLDEAINQTVVDWIKKTHRVIDGIPNHEEKQNTLG